MLSLTEQNSFWPEHTTATIGFAPNSVGDFRWRAAEYLVAADLCLAGYDCCLSAEGTRYDLIAEFSSRLIKIQVKSTRGVRSDKDGGLKTKTGYIFKPKTGVPGGFKSYRDSIDIMAFVALDLRLIIYQAAFRVPYSLILPAVHFTPERSAMSLESAIQDLEES